MTDILRNDFGIDKRVDEVHTLLCSLCRRETKHKVLKSVTHDWATEDMQGDDDYLIVQCLGCEGVSYCTITNNSEQVDYDTGKYYGVTTQLPAVNIEHEEILLPFYTPKIVRATYSETSKALSAGLLLLGSVGIRMVVELICKAEKASGHDLESMIESLSQKGVISQNVANAIHGVRFFGNDATHEGKINEYQLKAAWQTVNTIILYIYGSRDSEDVLLTEKRASRLEASRARKQKRS